MKSIKYQLFLIAFAMTFAAVMSGCGSGKHVLTDNSTKYYNAYDYSTNRVITTVTGTLQLYCFKMEGDMVPVKKCRRTGEFEEIGYFIELDHEMDVKPYFTESERKYWNECGASTIYVNRARVFCSNDIDLTSYRTHRVRLTGWFESREFGWRNAGPTVFIIQQVEVLENGE